ncbi:MAG: GGDEF domain-containing protein [Oscillospiraceae bacterium]|nr:GGDEF domain-containing protein [Oscillospiraceae bacterium]
MVDGCLMVGFCCTTMQKEPIRPVVDALVDRFEAKEDYRMIVYHCFEDLYFDTPSNRGASSIFNMINLDMLDIMILMQSNEMQQPLFNKMADRCRKHNVPVISIDVPYGETFNISFGYGDAFGQIVEHVITEHGCKRIKHVAGQRNNDFSKTRIDSCREIMAKHGLVLEDNDIMYGEFWETPTYAVMDEFFASGEPLPDAFVCANDAMAMAVCHKLGEKGYKVPKDVVVTGFDGIEIEKYHNPRLTTAKRDINALADALLDMIAEIAADPTLKPYNRELCYTPVFSESCGCKARDSFIVSQFLSEYVRNYDYIRVYEETMNEMGNTISANATLDNAREMLRKYSFAATHVCVTDDYYRYFTEEHDKEELVFDFEDSYPEKMHLLVDCSEDCSDEGTSFPTSQILPNLMDHFDGKHTLYVIPLHSQEKVIGYYTMCHLGLDLCKNQMYTYTMMTNQCLETVRTHEYMSFLNKKLEFMFTHDHLTKIYNRYGFYKNFREDFAELASENKDVFIVSIDLNDMKTINDTYGHHAGDDALRITANALTGAAEKGDSEIICSRFGGDEFVVAKICTGDAKDQAERYRRNFDTVLAALNAASGNPYTVAVSIGIYCASLNAVDTVDELIELADRLMYNDKARHKRRPKNLK